MSAIHGEMRIYWKPSTKTWGFMLDLGMKPNGKPNRREITSKSKSKLISKRATIIRDINEGTYNPNAKPTLAAWWAHWVENISRPRTSPSTTANYRSYGRVHIIPAIGARRLDKITVDDIRHLHAKMREHGSGGQHIKNVHITLTIALSDAVREGVIPRNPADMMDTPRGTPFERQAFTLDEARALIATAKQDGPRSHTRALLALNLGARQGECIGLEWDRVDLDARTIDLSWQLNPIPWAHGPQCDCPTGRPAHECLVRVPDAPDGFEARPCHMAKHWTRPKTVASKRLVPIPDVLVDALKEWQCEWRANPWGLLWVSKGGTPLSVSADRQWWKALCRRAGVRELDLHSARHTTVSLMLESGVDPEVIRLVVGHSSVLSTRNYMHISGGFAREALGFLGG